MILKWKKNSIGEKHIDGDFNCDYTVEDIFFNLEEIQIEPVDVVVDAFEEYFDVVNLNPDTKLFIMEPIEVLNGFSGPPPFILNQITRNIKKGSTELELLFFINYEWSHYTTIYFDKSAEKFMQIDDACKKQFVCPQESCVILLHIYCQKKKLEQG